MKQVLAGLGWVLTVIGLTAPAQADKTLEKAVAEAEAHPLGSLENPVRVSMPPGQRAYLAQLRCSDGTAPEFGRVGNVGVGVFGNFVDHYRLRCAIGTPAEASVYMDMYHAGRTEHRAVPGFTLATPVAEAPSEAV